MASMNPTVESLAIGVGIIEIHAFKLGVFFNKKHALCR